MTIKMMGIIIVVSIMITVKAIIDMKTSDIFAKIISLRQVRKTIYKELSQIKVLHL